MRLLAALSVAALLPFAAGCGGAGSPGGAAPLVPAELALYAVVDTDFEGDSWEAVDELAARFPGGENFLQRLIEEAEAEAGADGLDFETDVEPALGPEVVLVVLSFDPSAEGEAPAVVLTQPDDDGAFRRLLAQAGEPVATQEVDGWQAIATDQAALDAFLEARNGPRLSDAENFERAVDGLDDDALALVYVDDEAYGTALPAGSELPPEALALVGATPAATAFALTAEDDGVRVDGRMVFSQDVEDTIWATEEFEAELPETVPADALVYVGFSGYDQLISRLRETLAQVEPELESQIGQLESFLGVSLEGDIAPLLSDEGALYVRRGALIPEVTLLLRVEDEEEAVATLDRMVAGAGAVLPLGEAERSEIAGVEVRTLSVSPPITLSYAGFDGLLVLTTARDGIAALRGDGDRLADDEDFRDALDAADVPDETTGLGYVDLAAALPLLYGYAEAGLGGGADEARGYTAPLRSLVFYGTEGGESAESAFFLGIE